MSNNVKSGKEILDDFFKNIHDLKSVDPEIATLLATLYENKKLTDTHIKNELLLLRKKDNNNDSKN